MEGFAADSKVLVVEGRPPFNRLRTVVVYLAEEEFLDVRRVPVPMVPSQDWWESEVALSPA